MDASGWADFLFAGSVILPTFLLLAAGPGLALIAFVALLVAGCLCSIADPEAPHRKGPPG